MVGRKKRALLQMMVYFLLSLSYVLILKIISFLISGERCVHLAAQAGHIDILRILVLYGADINARVSFFIALKSELYIKFIIYL
mgnify:CR=1 FL=1